MPEPGPSLPTDLPLPHAAVEGRREPVPDPRSADPLPLIPVEEPRVALPLVQSPWTGIVGALTLFLAHVAIGRGWIDDRYFRGPFLEWVWNAHDLWALVLVFLVMAAMEGLVFRVYRRHFDFSTARTLDGAAWRRIEIRWFGLFALFILAWAAYLILDTYRADLFFLHRFNPKAPVNDPEHSAFFSFLFLLTPVVLTVAPFYYWIVERNIRELRPEKDELYLVGQWLAAGARRRTPDPAVAGLAGGAAWRDPHFRNVFRSWGVKVFFLPLMFTWYGNSCASWQSSLSLMLAGFQQYSFSSDSITLDHATRVYMTCFEGVFLLDLALCVVGYSFTLRLFDTHVRSAEPTIFGWLVAIACYPPFNRTTEAYIAYGTDREWLGPFRTTFASHPSVFIAWGAAIILLLAIYVLSTVMFGMRFSNLTNRGILCRGPYAIVRHPAYVSKNLAWWLMSVPFMRNFGDCLRLLAWNVIYLLRAKTEEAHLGQDPHYREYMTRVKWRFIPWVW